MKKIYLIFFLILFSSHFVSAVWWNPWTWFQDPEENYLQEGKLFMLDTQDWILKTHTYETDYNEDGIPDVISTFTEINDTYIEVYVNDTRETGGYKWASAICNLGGVNSIQKEEYNPSTQVWTNTGELNYGTLWGLPEDWCPNHEGFSLYGSGSGDKRYRLILPEGEKEIEIIAGKGSEHIIVEYQDLSMLNYELDWGNANITLFKNIDGEYSNTVNDLFIYYNNDSYKFGADDSANEEIEQYKYQIKSTNPIYLEEQVAYIFNPEKIQYDNYGYFQTHDFDFSDICNKKIPVTEDYDEMQCLEYSEPECAGYENISVCTSFGDEICTDQRNVCVAYDVDEETCLEWYSPCVEWGLECLESEIQEVCTGEYRTCLDEQPVKNANCEFNSYEETIDNVTSYYLEVEFLSDDNIDPTISIGSSDMVSTSYLNNVTAEFGGDNNVTHLTIDEDNSYLTFNANTGADVVVLADSDAVENVSGMAVCVWAKTPNTAGNNEFLINQWNNPYNFYLRWNTNEDVAFSFRNESSSDVQGYRSTDAFQDDNWHHVCGVYNGTGAFVTYDGEIGNVIASASGNTYSPNAEPIYIGKSATSSYAWNGSIDEVRIYNRSLTVAEIVEIYNSGMTPNASLNSTGLVSWYDFEDGIGVSLKDRISGLDGTLSGSPTWSSWGLGDHLVGYWNFDGDLENTVTATAYDWSSSGNDGVMVDDAIVNPTDTMYGDSLLLDGTTDRVTISGANVSVDGKDETTVMLWVKNDLTTSAGSDVFTFDSSGDYEMTWNTNEQFSIIFDADGTSDTTTCTTVVNDNNWHHLVGRYNGTAQSIWLDGVHCNSEAQSGVLDISGTDLEIGGDGTEWDGRIDEFMLFDTALTSQQILGIYNNQSPRYKNVGEQKVRAVPTYQDGTYDTVNLTTSVEENLESRIEARVGQINTSVDTTGLVAYYPFEWGTAVDISGEGNDGTLVGDTYFNSTGGVNGTGGFSFDGDGDAIEVIESLNDKAELSISAWIYSNEWDSIKDQPIVATYRVQDNGHLTLFKTTGGFIGFSLRDTSAAGGTNRLITSTSVSGFSGWHHVVAIYSNITQVNSLNYSDLYLDGSNAGMTYSNTNETWVSDTTDSDFRIGARTTVYDSWNGSIDEVMIFNRSLSATEIASLYSNQSAKYNNIYYTPYQNITSGVNATFNISTEADFILADYKFVSGNSTRTQFYSPLTQGSSTLTWNQAEAEPPTDTTAPTYSLNQTNSTILNQSTLFSLYWNDETALETGGQYIFSTNNTGVWVNETAVNFTSTPQWANITKTLNDTEGVSIGWRMYASDNAGNVNVTEIFELTTTAEAGDTCTYSGSGNWEINCADNCSIDSPVDLLGNNISIIGTGTFITTANITNFVKLFIQGTDESNICHVTCFSGGCFQK